MSIDVVILTAEAFYNIEQPDWYIQQVLAEDAEIQASLEQQGLTVKRLPWSDASFDWTQTKSALFRTTWDYFDRFTEFKPWLDKASKQTRLINLSEIIYWNMDKHYLQDLQQQGVNVVTSHFIEQGTAVNLRDLMTEFDVHEAIIKPAVSGGGRHTYRLNHDNVDEYQELITDLLKEEAFMIQPFQQYVVEQGELSLIVIDGQCTHAVKKVAKAGDFRVQDNHGGKVYGYEPTAEEREFAQNAIAACSPQPLYARVDMIRDNNNELAIMELELIEPELFFRFGPGATDRLAQAIKHQLCA